MNKKDLESYKTRLATRQYSRLKTDEMLARQFDVDEPYELDDEEEPVSDWIKELMMDDEEWMEMRQDRDLSNMVDQNEPDHT